MAFNTRKYMSSSQAEAAHLDVGLREHMLRVYNYMASGLALTGILAWVVATVPAIQMLFFQPTGGLTGLGWIAFLAPIGLVLLLSFGVHKMKASTAMAVFWGYAALMGVSLAAIFMAYTAESIARVFFITAATFGAMSLYGYTTKRDLSGFGSFLFMGLIGMLIAMVVNIFLQSTMLHFLVSVVGVLIFTGLTAYDTQKIKEAYYEGDDADTAGKKAIMGALALYLDFINLFIMLMRLIGERR
ncbi:Bax inhibitor-1/YccA family protein [Telmatospirillum sp. J64-1]|uniref:Bax inhibitor-1/YccA family protein n=1 Tax=Telmatospirillum sp. J64-1 TaxID=2502183 RepID=UPI00115DC438|nr:Bax inhibitor-1/YccA family protein [Telmatospirillum sp. J64-1]